MTDIFMSYVRADQKAVEMMADMLETDGYSVWLSSTYKDSANFQEELRKALDQAKCIMVVWSNASVKKRFILEEARQAMKRGILVSVQIEECEIPSEFRSTGVLDFGMWTGDDDELVWEDLSLRLGTLIEEPEGPTAESSKSPPRNRHIIFILFGVLIMGALVGGYYYLNQDVISQKLEATDGEGGDDQRYIPPWQKQKNNTPD